VSDPPTITDELRWLFGVAADAGADPVRLQALANVVVENLAELDAYRRGAFDPRRRQTLMLAQRVQSVLAAGIGVQEVCERFGLSRAYVYRLKSLRTSGDKSLVDLLAVNQR
jgi:hypothetical protein